MTLLSTELREARDVAEQAETFKKVGGNTVGHIRAWLGVCPRCGERPIWIQGMVCLECYQAQERSDRD